MPEDAKRRNSRKKKKRKAAKKRSFFQSIFSAVKYVVLSINRYTTRTDDRGPDREFHLGRHKLTFVGFMALLLVVLVVILLAFNGHSVKVANESIIVTGLPDDFEGYRILHISDLAGKNFGEGQSTLMRVIDNLSYNAVVLTGDMVGKRGDPQPLYDLIEALGTRRPVYFIAGDSDPAPLRTEARDNSLGTMTLNQMVLSDWVLGAIERGAIYVDCPQRITKGSSTLWLLPDTLLNLNVTQTLDELKEEVEQETDSMLIGIEESYVSLPFTNYRMNVMSKSAALISSVSSQDLILMLSHEVPTDSQLLDSQKALSSQDMKSYFLSPDLVLGGHYCGGEWKFPPFGALYINSRTLPRYGWFPDQKYVEGQRTVGSSIVYVTPGLGTNGSTLLGFRLLNPPRVSLITLTGELPSSLLN